jgi:hypothetical protein
MTGPGRGSSFVLSPCKRRRQQVRGGAAGGRAQGAAPQRCGRCRPGRGQRGRAHPQTCTRFFATLSNCGLWGSRRGAARRAKESWVRGTAASGSTGAHRERGLIPPRAGWRGGRRHGAAAPADSPREWHSRASPGVLGGGLRPFAQPLGVALPGPTSARPAESPAGFLGPGSAPLRSAPHRVSCGDPSCSPLGGRPLLPRLTCRRPPPPRESSPGPACRPRPPSAPRGRRVLPSSGSRCRQSARFLRQPRIPAAALRPDLAWPARPRPRPRPRPRRAGRRSAALGRAAGPGRRAWAAAGIAQPPEPAAEQRRSPRSPRARAFPARGGGRAAAGAGRGRGRGGGGGARRYPPVGKLTHAHPNN